jgi:hypothetical protein
METRSKVPDRKLLARLVIVREEARNMMGGGLLDERNDRGLNTLPQAEVCFRYVETPDMTQSASSILNYFAVVQDLLCFGLRAALFGL